MNLRQLNKLKNQILSLSRNKRLLAVTAALLLFGLGLDQALTYSQQIVNDPGFYPVVSVSDGDTIVVDMNGDEQTIRFIGVDTPETHHPSRPVQCFGQAATNFTRNLLEGAQVRLEADPLSSNRDRYDRLLRYVYTKDNQLVNQSLVAEGYGFAYVSFPFSKKANFIEAEENARTTNKGLWKSCNPELNNGYLQTQGVS